MKYEIMNFDTLRIKMLQEYQKWQSWRLTGNHYGITKGLAYRIVIQGYEPKDPHIRVLLHLPALVPAPVCQKCGEVHVSKRCTAVKHQNPPRVTIRLDDPCKAAQTIIKHMDAWNRELLKRML